MPDLMNPPLFNVYLQDGFFIISVWDMDETLENVSASVRNAGRFDDFYFFSLLRPDKSHSYDAFKDDPDVKHHWSKYLSESKFDNDKPLADLLFSPPKIVLADALNKRDILFFEIPYLRYPHLCFQIWRSIYRELQLLINSRLSNPNFSFQSDSPYKVFIPNFFLNNYGPPGSGKLENAQIALTLQALTERAESANISISFYDYDRPNMNILS